MVANALPEVVEFPLKYFAGKGKEKEPPILKLGLKWAGRMAKVEQLGLPIRAPGKMFRLETRPVPLAPEDSVSTSEEIFALWRTYRSSSQNVLNFTDTTMLIANFDAFRTAGRRIVSPE